MMSDPERVSRGNTPITVPAEQEVQKNGKAPSEGRHRRVQNQQTFQGQCLVSLRGKHGGWCDGEPADMVSAVTGSPAPPVCSRNSWGQNLKVMEGMSEKLIILQAHAISYS